MRAGARRRSAGAPRGDLCRRDAGDTRRVRAMFVVYLLVIVVGLTYFTVIGLTHH